MSDFVMSVGSKGSAKCLFNEDMDLSALGPCSISRVSYVEPDEQGQWWADLFPSDGPKLGPFRTRSDAIEAEVAWLEIHVLHA